MADRIAAALLKRLTVKKYLDVKDEGRARTTIKRVLLENLQAEEKLEADARQILLEHAKEIKDAVVDYGRMFAMVKGKLARERGFIL